MAKLKQRLRIPLARGTPLRMARETHAQRLVRRVDNGRLPRGDIAGLGALHHLEGLGHDLVERDLLGPLALVDDVEAESFRAPVAAARLESGGGGGMVEGTSEGRQGQTGGEDERGEVHCKYALLVIQGLLKRMC